MKTSLLKVLRRRAIRRQIGAVTRLILTLLIIPALLRSPFAAQAPGGVAIIPDIALKHSLLATFNKTGTNEITVAEMQSLRDLTVAGFVIYDDDDSDYLPIQDLTGLELATDLRSLTISRHEQVSNLPPIRGLTKLELLRVPSNAISDLEPISGLTNLTVLRVNDNRLQGQIAPVAQLARLTELSIENDGVTSRFGWKSVDQCYPFSGFDEPGEPRSERQRT
jgi:hypothetical protein